VKAVEHLDQAFAGRLQLVLVILYGNVCVLHCIADNGCPCGLCSDLNTLEQLLVVFRIILVGINIIDFRFERVLKKFVQ